MLLEAMSRPTLNMCFPLLTFLEDRIWRQDFGKKIHFNKTKVINNAAVVTAANDVNDNYKFLQMSLLTSGKWKGNFHVEYRQSSTDLTSFLSSRTAKLSSFETMFRSGFSRVLYLDSDILVVKPLLESAIAPFLDKSSNAWDNRCDIYVQRPSSKEYILNGGIVVADETKSRNVTKMWRAQVLRGNYAADQDAFRDLHFRNGMSEHTFSNDKRNTYCYLPNSVRYSDKMTKVETYFSFFSRRNSCTFYHFKGKKGEKNMFEDSCKNKKWPCDMG